MEKKHSVLFWIFCGVCLIAVFMLIRRNTKVVYKSSDKFDSFMSYYKTKNKHLHAELFYLLNAFHNICRNLHVRYFVTGGTLLGSVRHQGFIPWDDDLDVGVMKSDIGKVVKEITTKHPQFMLKFRNGGWKFENHLSDTTASIKFIRKGRPYFLDIFIYVKADDRYEMFGPTQRAAWPEAYFLSEELFPLKQYKFEDLLVWGPRKNEDHLSRNYGSDWRERHAVTHTHF